MARPFQIDNSLIDSKGNFWIGTQGQSIQKWNKTTKSFEAIPFLLKLPGIDTLVANKNIAAFGLAELKNGNILASSYQHGLYFYNQNSNSFDEFKLTGEFANLWELLRLWRIGVEKSGFPAEIQ